MMRICEHCFSQLRDIDSYCPECGAPASGEPAAEGSDAIIYPELARANLLRMRGDLDGAEKVLLAVLKRYPGNATSQILIGDLYMERGDVRGALQWFEMARDLAPETIGLSSKIDRARAAVEREEHAAGASGLEVSTSRFPFLVMALVAGIVLIVSATAFYLAGARVKRAELDRLDDIVQPISINQPAGAIEKRDQAPSAANQGENPSKPDPSPSGEMATTDRGLYDAMLRANSELEGTLSSVQLDPRTGRATISLLHKAGDGDPLLVAAIAGQAATKAAANVGSAVVRLIDATSRDLIFVGTFVGALPEGSSAAPGTPEWAELVMTDVWRP